MTTSPIEVPTVNGTGPYIATAEDVRRRREAPCYLELPESGLTVQVTRAHIAELARGGAIPNRLTGAVMRVLRMPDAPPRPSTVEDVVAESMDLVNTVCQAILVSPRMAPDPLEGTNVIAPSDLPYADREYLFGWAARTPGVVPLDTFPQPADGGVAPVADGPDVADTAE